MNILNLVTTLLCLLFTQLGDGCISIEHIESGLKKFLRLLIDLMTIFSSKFFPKFIESGLGMPNEIVHSLIKTKNILNILILILTLSMRKILQLCLCPNKIINWLSSPTYEDVKEAVLKDDFHKVVALAQIGAPLSHKGQNILHFCIDQSNLSMIRNISQEYCQLINERNQDGDSPLMKALFIGDQNIINYLSHISNLNVRDNNGNSAIIIAAANGNLEFLQNLLNNPAVNTMIKNFEGQTALHRACYFGQIEAIKLLLKHTKLKLSQVDYNGNNSMHLACEGLNIACARFIKELLVDYRNVLVPNKIGLTPYELMENKINAIRDRFRPITCQQVKDKIERSADFGF